MSNLVAFSQAGLPAVSTLSSALRAIQSDVGPAGTAILKMDKTGHWVFGADQTEVEDDSKWAVNPFSFVHGFIAWGDGEVLAEKMTSVSQGGKKAVQAIAVALAEQVEKDQTKPVAVVSLKKDHYAHKSYGKIYTPVFAVTEWISMEGDAPKAEEAAPAPAAGRRRRSA